MNDWKMQREETIKLINLYKIHRCLWDYSDPEYKHRNSKKIAWSHICKVFGQDVSTLKKKMKHLRSAYAAEKKKVDEFSNNFPPYRPHLFYYGHMNFLDSVIFWRKPPSSDNNEQKTKEIEKQFESCNHDTDNQSAIEEEYMPVPSPETTNIQDLKHNKINKQKSLDPYYTKLDAAVTAISALTKTKSEQSVYTAFGRTIALQLMQLPPLEATATMSEIHQILTRNVVKSLSRENTTGFCAEEEHDVIAQTSSDEKLSTLLESVVNNLGENGN